MVIKMHVKDAQLFFSRAGTHPVGEGMLPVTLPLLFVFNYKYPYPTGFHKAHPWGEGGSSAKLTVRKVRQGAR